MKKALLLYSSTDGQTIKILNQIKNDIKDSFDSELVDLHTLSSIEWQSYDRVLIGASVRYGHLSKELYRFISNNLDEIKHNKVAFFCVNLTARKEGKDTPQGSVYMRKFLKRSSWRPDLMAVFAGALFYPRYNLFDRSMIKLIMKITGGETDTSKEVEYTDWQKVTQFAKQFAEF